MSSINVKSGVQFRPELYGQPDRNKWLEAVGQELEKKGVSVKVGWGPAAQEVKNAAELVAAYKTLEAEAQNPSTGGWKKEDATAYLTDLVEALDDVAKSNAKLGPTDKLDFSKDSEMSTALGLNDTKVGYGWKASPFGKAAQVKAEATMAIGGVTLQKWGGEIDLASIPHMSAETLKSAPVDYGRAGLETEVTGVVTGLKKEQLVELAAESLNELQRPKGAVGLTLADGRSIDDMAWDSDAHAMRRLNPYVSFTLDSRSLETNPNSGEQRVGVGRDFFFDTFMAAVDLNSGEMTKDLQKAELMFRTRIRYGGSKTNPFAGTRVLIGAKLRTKITPEGKSAEKFDSRTDSSNQQVFDTLLHSAQTGKLVTRWDSGDVGQVPPAAAAMYRAAVQEGITQDIGGETDVLALEAGAVARQIRARFHLNETSSSAVVNAFAQAGEPKIIELVRLIQAAPDWNATADLPSKSQLLEQANALLDRSAIVATAAEGLKKLDPNLTVDRALIDRLWPDQNPPNRADLKLQRVVADAIRQEYDKFAENIDGLQRQIGGNADRSVRDAGSANDVRDFFRQKAAVARFMALAPRVSNGKVVAGDVASFARYAKEIVAMGADVVDDDQREEVLKQRDDLLKQLGVGRNQLREMNEASFASVVQVQDSLLQNQTMGAFIGQLDAQMAGPTKNEFIGELSAFLDSKRSRALKNATDKDAVVANLRKNMVTAHTEILHRQVEGAAAWGQAAWFNNYRQGMLGLNPEAWGNFLIASMDYTEFYDAEKGGALAFKERVSKAPLKDKVSDMTGAMISNDVQIELQAEEAYTGAIRAAQYAVNRATAGLLMDFALAQNTPGLSAGDSVGFENWLSQKASLGEAERTAFFDEVSKFAASIHSPIDIAKNFDSLVEQQKAISLLTVFAKGKDASVNSNERAQAWYREQAMQGEAKLNDLLTELARFAADYKSDVPLSPTLLGTLDFTPFASTNVGQPVTSHAQALDNLAVAQEVWAMVRKAQADLSDQRGRDVQEVLKDNELTATWEPPVKAKGDYAIDYAFDQVPPASP